MPLKAQLYKHVMYGQHCIHVNIYTSQRQYRDANTVESRSTLVLNAYTSCAHYTKWYRASALGDSEHC